LSMSVSIFSYVLYMYRFFSAQYPEKKDAHNSSFCRNVSSPGKNINYQYWPISMGIVSASKERAGSKTRANLYFHWNSELGIWQTSAPTSTHTLPSICLTSGHM
jgi:hypothetical protein